MYTCALRGRREEVLFFQLLARKLALATTDSNGFGEEVFRNEGDPMYSLVKKFLAQSFQQQNEKSRLRRRGPAVRRARPCLETLESRLVPSGNLGGLLEQESGPEFSKAQQSTFEQTNLVSDVPGLAELTDPNLKNPWGMSFSATSPFWVSDQGTNKSTLYSVNASGIVSINSLVVNIPTTAAGPQGPTGQVQNNTSSFPVNGTPASFIFADLNGTISAWNGSAGTSAVIKATTPGAVYTGLAIATNASGAFLYAANGAQNRIDVFDGSFTPVNLGANAFQDPMLPKNLGLVPFNVQNIGGLIYVTYAPAGRAAQIAAPEGEGAVAIFDTNGKFMRQLIVGGELASPWGLAMAPASFGAFGGDLLVGNFSFGVSEINAFNPTTGKFLGTLTDASGKELLNPGLWALAFGRGGNNGDPNTLYFTAGINGEADGLFGAIQAVPTIAPKAPIVPALTTAPKQTISTVPTTNKDVNPYGIAFVPPDIKPGGVLKPGDILVSNYNNSDNKQGTGTTIERITADGGRSVFFQGSAGLGLTTALGVLKSGFVIVGNVPTTDGTFATLQQGSLLILDSNGKVVETLTDPQLLDGPWDLTINDHGNEAQVFVSNVLNGTVTRIDLKIPKNGNPIVQSMTRIASGYKHDANDAVFVVGPAGLAYDAARDILYVASTDDNAIYAIKNAGRTHADSGKGTLIYQDPTHLHGPLGLVLAPNGDLIAANSDAINADPKQPSELVEFTTTGKFVGQFSIDPAEGGAFGVALSSSGGKLRLAAVNDNNNTLDLWTFVTTPQARRGEDNDLDEVFRFFS
jgi:uncharacterized protein (TIGR03118 family)